MARPLPPSGIVNSLQRLATGENAALIREAFKNITGFDLPSSTVTPGQIGLGPNLNILANAGTFAKLLRGLESGNQDRIVQALSPHITEASPSQEIIAGQVASRRSRERMTRRRGGSSASAMAGGPLGGSNPFTLG